MPALPGTYNFQRAGLAQLVEHPPLIRTFFSVAFGCTLRSLITKDFLLPLQKGYHRSVSAALLTRRG